VCATASAICSWLVRDSPLPPVQHSGRPTLFATCLFVVIAYYSGFFFFFGFFPLGGGQSTPDRPGLIWPRVVCGSTTSRLAHFVVCIFPSRLGAAVWRQLRSPPGFSV
jgi:hypothetical protein